MFFIFLVPGLSWKTDKQMGVEMSYVDVKRLVVADGGITTIILMLCQCLAPVSVDPLCSRRMMFRVHLLSTVAADGFCGPSGWASTGDSNPGACVLLR